MTMKMLDPNRWSVNSILILRIVTTFTAGHLDQRPWNLITKVRHNQETNLVAKECELVVTRVVICVQIADNFTWLHLRINQTHETSDNSLLLPLFFKMGNVVNTSQRKNAGCDTLMFYSQELPLKHKSSQSVFCFFVFIFIVVCLTSAL